MNTEHIELNIVLDFLGIVLQTFSHGYNCYAQSQNVEITLYNVHNITLL